MVCGFSCEDLISMFKELKGLGVVVKELSNELRQLVRKKPRPSACLLPKFPFCVLSDLWVIIPTCIQLSSKITLDTFCIFSREDLVTLTDL